MSVNGFLIGQRLIETGQPAWIVAELSANHGGSLDTAVELVHAAAEAGADAVKIQTFTPDTITLPSSSDAFTVGEGMLWSGRSLYDLYAEAQTPWEWHEPLAAAAKSVGITLFSSPFDKTAVDFLDELGVPAFKIASFELVDHELIAYAASKGRPLIMSTGMATKAEITEAVEVARDAGADGLALLHCVSAYPARLEEMNLRTIADMEEMWSVPVGLSDHTHGEMAAVAAVTLGASIVEKHFKRDGDDHSPDAAFSLTPRQFRDLVDAIRTTETSLGTPRYGPTDDEKPSVALRRSLFVVRDLRAGDVLTEESVRSLRPAAGLAPKFLPQILGRRVVADTPRGTPLSWDLIS
jgi:pseudaminic acid synthase